MDTLTLGLIGFVLLLLIAATVVVRILKRRVSEARVDLALVETFRVRVRAWWTLFAGLAAAFLSDQYFAGHGVTILLFGFISFWALREFITLTPTRPGDHFALFFVFTLLTPAQFVLVWLERYDLYSTLIPVYAFLLIPARIALSGDAKRFLERTAKIQSALLICVYCLSFAPALLTLEIPPYDPGGVGSSPGANQEPYGEAIESAAGEAIATGPGETPAANTAEGAQEPKQEDPSDVLREAADDESGAGIGAGIAAGTPAGGTVRLLFFFVLMTQLSDALQFAWSKLPSRHLIVPTISQTRTWEGFLGGMASVTLLGAALRFATPFPHWWQPACASAVIALMGFAGGLTMSAIKRDRGVKDFGTLVEGHGGVLDRIDSICFAAPVFFHLAYFLLTGDVAPTCG
ncbi:MAG TPA: phosphatidate cytidylyltransferase [Thermoguttaceae bacterium]|nr:phosphatidate cytidylyltransferase [Thermoguttaceae bacterium]